MRSRTLRPPAAGLGLALAVMLFPADPVAAASASAPSRTAAMHASPSPRTAGALPMETRFFLRDAFRVAVSRLEEVPACRALFAELGADGTALLAAAVFRPPRSADERAICQGAAAFTRVGGSETALCPRLFRALPRKRAAAVLLHEALHHAGRTEAPADPEAPSSEELTEIVEEECRL